MTGAHVLRRDNQVKVQKSSGGVIEVLLHPPQERASFAYYGSTNYLQHFDSGEIQDSVMLQTIKDS